MRISDWSSDVCSSDLSGFPCAPCGYLWWGSRSRSPMAAGTWGDVASNRSKQRGRRHRLPEIKDKASIEWEPARQVAGVGDQNAVEGGAFPGPARRRSLSDPVWEMLSSPAPVRLVRRAYRFRVRALTPAG